jgi:hypothetical protein
MREVVDSLRRDGNMVSFAVRRDSMIGIEFTCIPLRLRAFA